MQVTMVIIINIDLLYQVHDIACEILTQLFIEYLEHHKDIP